MRIFATNQYIKHVKESSSNSGLYGVGVATNDFYKNLIRFGRFDEYHFFILSENTQRRFHKRIIPYVSNKRVKFDSITQLPVFLKKTKNFLFFTSSPGIFNIAHLRSIYAKRYFPVSGMTHTISYAGLISNIFFQNLICDLQPFDSIICTSKPVLRSVRKMYRLISKDIFNRLSLTLDYKARLDCLPLGINTEDYMKYNKYESRKALKLPAQKIIILYFGRFSISDKADLNPLLLVFKNLLSKLRSCPQGRDKNILLVLAGKNFQGDYGGKLKKIANDLGISREIKFFFNLSRKEKYLLYTASDIFVSPSDSLQESFGLTILEAMASGLPVVVSDWDGYKDMVSHNKTGFLIPTYWARCDEKIAESSYLFRNDIHKEHLLLGQSVCIDTKKMMEYLWLFIKNEELRLRFGHNARERALRYYDWAAVIPKYETLWSTLIEQAKAHKAPLKRRPIFYPGYFECFKHYPSHILNKRTDITVTEEGMRLLKTKNFAAVTVPLNFILPQVIFLILFYLKERKSSNPEKIKDHINEFSKEISRDKVNYHIMWMLKHNLAGIIS